jgi:hypothetical protein
MHRGDPDFLHTQLDSGTVLPPTQVGGAGKGTDGMTFNMLKDFYYSLTFIVKINSELELSVCQYRFRHFFNERLIIKTLSGSLI